MKNLIVILFLLGLSGAAGAAEPAESGTITQIAHGLGVHTWVLDYLACGSSPCEPEGTQLFGEKMIYGQNSSGSDGLLPRIAGLFSVLFLALAVISAAAVFAYLPIEGAMKGGKLLDLSFRNTWKIVLMILMISPTISQGTIGQLLFTHTVRAGNNLADVSWKNIVVMLQIKNITSSLDGSNFLGDINQNAPGYIANFLCDDGLRRVNFYEAEPTAAQTICGVPSDTDKSKTTGAQRIQYSCYRDAYKSELLPRAITIPGRRDSDAYASIKNGLSQIKIDPQSVATAWPQFLSAAATCIYTTSTAAGAVANEENMIVPDSDASEPWINGWASAGSGSSIKDLANKKIVLEFETAAANPQDWTGWDDDNGIFREVRRQVETSITDFNVSLTADISKNGLVLASQQLTGDAGCELGSQCAQNAGGALTAVTAGVGGYFAKRAGELAKVAAEMRSVSKDIAVKVGGFAAKKLLAPVAMVLDAVATIPSVFLAFAVVLWMLRVCVWYLIMPLSFIAYAMPESTAPAPWKVPLGLALEPLLILLVYIVSIVFAGVAQDMIGKILFHEYGAGGFFANALAIIADAASFELFAKVVVYVLAILTSYLMLAFAMLKLPPKILDSIGLGGHGDMLDQHLTSGRLTSIAAL